MRVSTSMLHASGGGAIVKGQAELVRIQSQLSSGKRIQTASDDPIGAAQAMKLSETRLANERFAANQVAAKNALGLTETTLANIGDSLQRVRELIVQAGSASLSSTDRATLAQEVREHYSVIMGLANTQDGEGRFIFAGGRSSVQPFAPTAGGALYNGDQSQRAVQVSSTRSLTINESGAEVFERIRAGNGSFTTTAGAANSGTATIDVGRLVNAAAYTGDQYRLVFSVSGGATTYDVLDVTTAATVSTGNAYSDGNSITVAGMQFAISGSPAAGDTFDLAPAANQNIFATLQQTIAAIEAPQVTPADRAKTATKLGGALASLDQGFEHTLAMRAGLGAGLAELDLLAGSNAATDLALQSQLSEIVDVDYAQAITEFMKHQQALQAAQASYSRMMSLSLFDVLR